MTRYPNYVHFRSFTDWQHVCDLIAQTNPAVLAEADQRRRAWAVQKAHVDTLLAQADVLAARTAASLAAVVEADKAREAEGRP